MPTFNELLVANDIQPTDVILLRHSGKKNGISPHDLWLRRDGSFDRYESTQPPGAFFENAKYWASFVAEPDRGTLFLGLYQARKGDRRDITWLCAMTGLPPGQDRGLSADLYHLQPVAALGNHRENLRVDWGESFRRWNQYAARNDKPIIGDLDDERLARLESLEGEAIWQSHRSFERDSKLSRKALQENASRSGQYSCDACCFTNATRGLFDAHHKKPLLAGPRLTSVSDFLVLCPTCHRKAHQSPKRFEPHDLNYLKQWVAAGRP